MSDISTWLKTLGLERYVEVFESNEIDLDLAQDLDDESLEKLGITVMGHRLKILRALKNLPTAEAQTNIESAPAIPARFPVYWLSVTNMNLLE